MFPSVLSKENRVVAKGEKKAAPAVVAPRSFAEFADCLGRLDTVLLQQEALELKINEAIAKAKEGFTAEAQKLEERRDELFDVVYKYAEEKRQELTEEGKTSTVKTINGDVAWNKGKPSIKVTDEKAAIEDCKAHAKLRKFLRTVREINKNTMLANQALAATVRGVEVDHGVEEFRVKPHRAKLFLKAKSGLKTTVTPTVEKSKSKKKTEGKTTGLSKVA